MIQDKGSTQALFHFLLSQLIVECSEGIREEGEAETRLKQAGKEIGFKLYPQICLKRGVSQRPGTLNQLFKTLRGKLFKHLFNYQLTTEVNTYRIQQRQAIAYGLIDDNAIYLAWMPESVQMTASSLISGIIEAACIASDLKCSVSCRKAEPEKQSKNSVLYLIEVGLEEAQRWEKK